MSLSQNFEPKFAMPTIQDSLKTSIELHVDCGVITGLWEFYLQPPLCTFKQGTSAGQYVLSVELEWPREVAAFFTKTHHPVPRLSSGSSLSYRAALLLHTKLQYRTTAALHVGLQYGAFLACCARHRIMQLGPLPTLMPHPTSSSSDPSVILKILHNGLTTHSAYKCSVCMCETLSVRRGLFVVSVMLAVFVPVLVLLET